MTSKAVNTAVAVADAAAWYLALTLVVIVLLSSTQESSSSSSSSSSWSTVRGKELLTSTGRPCEEIYVVGEGETIHTISDKCGDPFIVEQNPHIHDPDDVFPGLVIRITPSAPRRDG